MTDLSSSGTQSSGDDAPGEGGGKEQEVISGVGKN